MKFRTHYNRCPLCGGYLAQLGMLDGMGGFIPDESGLWACTGDSHAKDINGKPFATRFLNKDGKFVPYIPFFEEENSEKL